MDSIELISRCFRKDEVLLYKYFIMAYITPSLTAFALFSLIP